MPIYEYRCDECGVSLEVLQKMSDEPLRVCECGGSLRKVLHPVAIRFKGSGFYTTDYGKDSGRRRRGEPSTDAASGDTAPAVAKPAAASADRTRAADGGARGKQKAS